MEEILSGMSVSEPLTALAADGDEPAAPASAKKKLKGKFKKEAAIVSQGERIVGILMNAGLMVRHSAGKMRFTNPVLLGYLSAQCLSPEEVSALTARLDWSAATQALRFVAAGNPRAPWIAPVLQSGSAPLHQGILTAARWLPDVPATAEWRTAVMRQLVSHIQNESLPVGVRARCAAAFIVSRDPSSAKLFRQLLTSHSSVIRRIAAMACGTLGLTAAMNDILGLLADPDVVVRNTACVAIGALPGEQSLSTIVEIMLQSDEELRRIAAETLALRPIDGDKLLEEASTSEDLLVRRAAVAGLQQIREDWSRQLLEKVAIEDSQWIVRNAASQALETFEQRNPFVPRPLSAPSEVPWLINFASRLGLGILPDKPATDVLLAALKTGEIDEQMGALEYLRNEADDGVIGVIYHSLYGDQSQLHEPALLAIWWIALTGRKLPDPTQFGLG
jgi:HEAT repeat protein